MNDSGSIPYNPSLSISQHAQAPQTQCMTAEPLNALSHASPIATVVSLHNHAN